MAADKLHMHRHHIQHGRVLANETFHGSDTVRSIQEQHVKVLYDDSMGMTDFYASNDVAIIYLTEADLIGGLDYKAKYLKILKEMTPIIGKSCAVQVRNFFHQ